MKELIKRLLREHSNDIELGSKDDVKYAQGVVAHTYSNEIEILKNKCKANKSFCVIYDDFVEAIAFNDKDTINGIIRKYFKDKLNES